MGLRSGGSAARIPHQARIEGDDGEHGQHHDGSEAGRAHLGIDLGELVETDQRHQDRDHEDVDHRPAADEVDDAEGAGAEDEMRCPAAAASGSADRPGSTSFMSGIVMLARKTSAASGHRP